MIGESPFPFERVETVGVGAGFFDFAEEVTVLGGTPRPSMLPSSSSAFAHCPPFSQAEMVAL